jgi:hypothetical protein
VSRVYRGSQFIDNHSKKQTLILLIAFGQCRYKIKTTWTNQIQSIRALPHLVCGKMSSHEGNDSSPIDANYGSQGHLFGRIKSNHGSDFVNCLVLFIHLRNFRSPISKFFWRWSTSCSFNFSWTTFCWDNYVHATPSWEWAIPQSFADR